jgi:hypothetical protein
VGLSSLLDLTGNGTTGRLTYRRLELRIRKPHSRQRYSAGFLSSDARMSIF